MPTPSIEDILNQAARGVGITRRIAWMYEGSELAKTGLEIFGQTRDELLRAKDWDFATRPVPLVLIKGPPPPGGYNPAQPWNTTYPPLGWLYEYGYPADALQIRAIRPLPFLMPDRDPRPVVFKVSNDFTLGGGSIITGGGDILTGGGDVLVGGSGGPSASGTKVILANVRNAVAIYRAQVTDPAQWNSLFLSTLIGALKEKLAASPLVKSLDLMKAAAQEAIAVGMVADKRRG